MKDKNENEIACMIFLAVLAIIAF